MCPVGVPTNTALPQVSGPNPAYVGSALSTTNGGWFSCNESITGYNYEWLRGGTVVSGPSTVPGYTAVTADDGYTMKSQVQACNADGCSTWATSSNGIPIINRPPAAPTNLAPATGTISSTRTPSLSAKFSDPDGQNGHINFAISRFYNGASAGSGTGSPNPVANNGTASWTTPTLTPGTRYTWTATDVDASSASSSAASASYTIPPNAPALVTPLNNASVATTMPVLSVSAASNGGSDPLSY